MIKKDNSSFHEIDKKIWDIGVDVFIPAAASRLINKNHLERMMKGGLNIISCGSFSKILAPSLRLGWIYCMDDTDEDSTLVALKSSSFYDSAGGTAAISSYIVEQLLDSGDLDKYITTCKDFLGSRCKTICDTLAPLKEKNLITK